MISKEAMSSKKYSTALRSSSNEISTPLELPGLSCNHSSSPSISSTAPSEECSEKKRRRESDSSRILSISDDQECKTVGKDLQDRNPPSGNCSFEGIKSRAFGSGSGIDDDEGADFVGENFNFDDFEALPNMMQNQNDERGFNIVFKTLAEDPTEAQLVKWLRKAEKGKLDEFIMNTPPIRPKGGEVILYRCKNEADEDYRRDQYTGMQAQYTNYRGNGRLQRTTFALRDTKKQIVPGFKKQAVCLRKNVGLPNKIILIWYSGDQTIWKAQPHGNSLKKDRMFTSTTPSSKNLIRKVAQQTDKTAMHVFRQTLQQVATQDPHFEQQQHVLGPRDKKQVENIQHALQLKRRVHKDEIMAVYLMGRTKMFGDFIREMKLLDKEAIILAETETLALAKALIKCAAKPSKKLASCLGFDTTFELTDANVSPLVMRNAFLQGDPIFPVAFLIHERRTADVHKLFWDTMKSLLPLELLGVGSPIVTDREAGLLKGLFSSLGEPGMTYHWLPCTVHIKRDVEQWLKSNKATSQDIDAYVGQIANLLNCEDENEFNEMYSSMEDTWSEAFVTYLDSKLKDDMKKAARFSSKRFAAFRDKDATSNFIESFNAILKHSAQWQELRVDNIVMNLFNVSMSYLSDFDRAYKALGNHHPKKQFAQQGPCFKLPPYAYWTEEKFLDKFKLTYEACNSEDVLSEAYVTSTKALARIACELGYVTLNSQTFTYTVTGPYDGKKAIVEEEDGGRLICSCDQNGMCMHKEAYLRVTKKTYEGNKVVFKLSSIRRKTRPTKGRSGRKKFDVNDVIPAPDSRVALRQILSDPDEQLDEAATSTVPHKAPTRAGKNYENAPKQINIVDVETGGHDFDSYFEGSIRLGPFIQVETEAISQNDAIEPQSNSDAESTVVSSEDDRMDTVSELMNSSNGPQNEPNIFDEEEDEDENLGLHFYAHKFSSGHESTTSRNSTTGHWSVANNTPEEYKIPSGDFRVESWVYNGVQRSLLGNKPLASDTIDNACAMWIKIHNLESRVCFGSTSDFENSLDSSMDSRRKLVSWAYRSEALNSDIMLVPLRSPETSRYMLGVILWRKKEIVFIASGPCLIPEILPLLNGLLRMVVVSHVVAECPLALQDWKCFLEKEIESQIDVASSGIHTILHVFTICSKQPFKSSNALPPIPVLRKWIAVCLSTLDYDNSVKLREGTPIRRLTPTQRTNLASIVSAVSTVPELFPVTAACSQTIQNELSSDSFNNKKCSFPTCLGIDESDYSERIMCCMCRNWYHVGSCVKSFCQQIVFYYCKQCEPSHAAYALHLYNN